MNKTERLKAIEYNGILAATARYDDEVEELKVLGVHTALNFFTEAGVGFADHVPALRVPHDDRRHAGALGNSSVHLSLEGKLVPPTPAAVRCQDNFGSGVQEYFAHPPVGKKVEWQIFECGPPRQTQRSGRARGAKHSLVAILGSI